MKDKNSQNYKIRTKSYDLVVDFKDYKMNKDMVDCIVYDQNDNETAIINAKLLMDKDPIDLALYDLVSVNIVTADGRKIKNECEIIDPSSGLIKIRLSKQCLLTVGFSWFKISLSNSTNNVVSPKFYYRVDKAIINEHEVKASDEYNIFMVLIQRTEKALDDSRIFHDKLVELNEILNDNEIIRNKQESNRQETEDIRNKNEVIRKANEIIRQQQESSREESIAYMQVRVDTNSRNGNISK